MKKIYKAGIDIGSTTAKMVVYDEFNNIIFKTYVRHNADVKETLLSILEKTYRVSLSAVFLPIPGSSIN